MSACGRRRHAGTPAGAPAMARRALPHLKADKTPDNENIVRTAVPSPSSSRWQKK